MKKIKKINAAGFTLIEVIAVLVIMGILAVGLSMGLIKGVEQYLFASEATQLSQKAQIALARIKKELTEAIYVTYKDDDRIDYTRLYSPPSCKQAAGCQYRIRKAGNQILMEGTNPVVASQILIDRVAAAYPAGVFLTFEDFAGISWNVESTTNYTVNNLARINVLLYLTYGSGNTIQFNTTINPRQGSKLNAPKLTN